MLLQKAPNVQGIVIALSGGMDSMVLLDLCSRLQSDASLPVAGLSWRVMHVNHGLHDEADMWQTRCVQACEQRSLSCQTFSLQLRETLSASSGEGLEAHARKARYQVMANHLQPQEVLLTAHHAQDQGETVLFRLLRGAGPKGLSGMRQEAVVPGSTAQPLWRPLLSESPETLQAYARQQQLHWVEDSSNRDITFSRNYLRHQVLPVIAQRWPSWLSSIERSADICRDSDELLQALANQWLVNCQGKQPGHLNIPALLQHSQTERDVMLRQWLWLHGRQWAGRTVLDQLTSMLLAGEDRQPVLAWQDKTVRRYRDELLVTQPLPLLPEVPEHGYHWPLKEAPVMLSGAETAHLALTLPGNGRLLLESVAEQGMRWPGATCRVCYRQEGIKARLPGRPGKSLKQLWQEAAVPPWLRDRSPLLFINGELAWIAGVGVCDGFLADPAEPSWLPRWEVMPD